MGNALPSRCESPVVDGEVIHLKHDSLRLEFEGVDTSPLLVRAVNGRVATFARAPADCSICSARGAPELLQSIK